MKLEENVINKMVLTIPSKSVNEAFARAAVGAFISPMDPTMEELADIKTAVSEAVTNCIVHGYPDRIGDIEIICTIFTDHSIEIRIIDQGVGIADIEKAREPMFTTGGADRSGMGFAIMERFMSRLDVESAPGNGTKVTMVRALGREQS